MTDTRNPDPHAELRAKYQAMVTAGKNSNEAARAFEFRPTYQSDWIRFKNGGISFLPEYEYRFNPIFHGEEGSDQAFTLHPTKSAINVYLELAEKYFALRDENEKLKADAEHQKNLTEKYIDKVRNLDTECERLSLHATEVRTQRDTLKATLNTIQRACKGN